MNIYINAIRHLLKEIFATINTELQVYNCERLSPPAHIIFELTERLKHICKH